MKRINKDKEIFGLHKIPDKELIKELRKEIGILNSEKDELKFLIEQKDSEINELNENIKKINENSYSKSDITLILRKEERYRSLVEQINNLNSKNRKLTNDNHSLISKLAIKCREYIELDEKFNKLKSEDHDEFKL